ncbi:uncharacterized protein LOC112467742 isoform X3 [Temnothorax curvispinosus]|uniref:Uncharacterized protein LOC112467742 isoform X3 n=1 Tax=Temnothorax curvispinosus TaxID=300111 RepID=A0A6J1RBA1_9HYME|nr:uncharacterized protein LOC112467742 isoform X3 [Temnothorax curvispinosus]
MFSRTMLNFFSGALLLIAIVPDAASYNKYGRTCKDIGCRSDETCVMAEDPCTGYTDKCGRYPTCRKTSDASCTSMVCGGNEYCKSENGAPKCVRKSTGLENDQMRTRTVPKRQTSYPTEAETHGSSDTSNNSDGQSYPARSLGYPSGSGYPGNSGYPSSGSSRAPDSTNQPRSGYPSSDSAGYSPSRSSGYPSSGSSGYPSSGSSGYPSSGSSGYSPSRSSGYPSSGSSGYPSSGSSGYPSQSSGYPSSGSSGYPLSGSSSHPSRDGSGYPGRSSGSSGYPDNSRNSNGEETVRRTGANAVNAGYPSYPSYPSYPRTSGYPEGNPSYRGNYYPTQGTGYPYNNQNSNQGNSNGYPENYPQGGYYQGQNYMTTTKRPGIRDQLTNFARNVAEKVLTQTILDRVTGRHQ